MGWDRRGYYYRSRKINGRVVREYIGSGEVAGLVAQMDAIDRQRRELKRSEERAEREELTALDAPLEELDALVDRLTRAALRAAGFHQHKRGEWRKQRVRSEQTN